MNLKIRLAVMNFLEFAVWGAYLTSMGRYLGDVGMGGDIGFFYSMQGVVSIFMPALIGIIADRWLNISILSCIVMFVLTRIFDTWSAKRMKTRSSTATLPRDSFLIGQLIGDSVLTPR